MKVKNKCLFHISVVLVLSVSVSLNTGNKNVALQDNLARSLSHVSKMLVDMENKIEQERKMLRQIDSNLNRNEQNDSSSIDTVVLDYDGITDIWWNSTHPPEHQIEGAAVPAVTVATATTATLGKYGNITITVKTTPLLFPRPPTKSTFPTHPTNWHLPTTTESAYLVDIKQNMALNQYGYYTAFVEEVSELMHKKDEAHAYPVAHHVSLVMQRYVNNGTFNSLGVDLLTGFSNKVTWFQRLSPARVKEQAGVLHFTIKMMDDIMPPSLKSLLKFYDNMFTKEEGEDLFEALEAFYVYPEGNITFQSLRESPGSTYQLIGERIFETALAPYIRSEGKRIQKRLIRNIIAATKDLDPHFRALRMPSLESTDTDANHSMTDNNQSAFPERRSMNYKKVIKHFFLKHPNLFRKIKRQYKHDKKNDHHRFSHTRKRHNNYRKSRGGHQRRERLYDRELTKRKVYTGSSYEPDSSESGAYFRENSKAYQQKNIHKIHRAKKSEIRLDKLKQHTQKQQNAKQIKWNILKGTRGTTKPYQDDTQYLKQLAIRFLRNKQQRQNFNRNRRFNILSSEEEICNHSQNFQDSIENHMLHKIREASSYSDEEDHLRNNLYDALRHGNRTFVSFRKSDGGVNNKQTLRAFSSETDEEWVFKNNIYKVFEQENKIVANNYEGLKIN